MNTLNPTHRFEKGLSFETLKPIIDDKVKIDRIFYRLDWVFIPYFSYSGLRVCGIRNYNKLGNRNSKNCISRGLGGLEFSTPFLLMEIKKMFVINGLVLLIVYLGELYCKGFTQVYLGI